MGTYILGAFQKTVFAAGVLIALFFAPKIADAATLFLSPGSGNYSVGSTITVSVRTNTQGASVNTAEANITYSTDTLELTKVTQGSTFYLPAPGSPTKGTGTAYFGGGVPTPGYSGTNGLLGTLTFRAKAIGTGTISISGGKVLLNDGFGTNALSARSGATFTIAAPAPPPVGTPTVTSTTHPDSAAWYTNRTVELSWSRPNGGYGFSFELDKNADTVPDNTLDTTITTQKSYPDLADGVWYFHIKARGETTGFGNTQHFRIGIDNVAPKPFEVKIQGAPNQQEIAFEAIDELSGIKQYDLYVDEVLSKENIQSPYKLSDVGNGTHTIKIVAIDAAGNKNEAQTSVIIEGAKGPGLFDWLKKSVEVPLYIILLFNLLLMLIILVLLLLLLKKGEEKKQTDIDINDLKDEIDANLNALKKEVTKKIAGLKANSKDELEKNEAKLSDEIKQDVGEAIDKIDTKIVKVTKRRTKKK